MKKRPFRTIPGAPQPLAFTVTRRVRFEEVDTLGIVWHGRYPSYFEDVREALGDRYGIGYLDFFQAEVAAPLRQLHFDYLKPLCLRENFTIKAELLHKLNGLLFPSCLLYGRLLVHPHSVSLPSARVSPRYCSMHFVRSLGSTSGAFLNSRGSPFPVPAGRLHVHLVQRRRLMTPHVKSITGLT